MASKKSYRRKTSKKPKEKFDMSKVKSSIENKLKKAEGHRAQILEQRAPVHQALKNLKDKNRARGGDFVETGVPGFDELFESGIPKGSTVVFAGGTGSGKTIFCLQTLAYHSNRGEKCFFMSLEESEEKLKRHMEDFGWNPEKLINSGKLVIKSFSPFRVTRNIDALLAKESFDPLLNLESVILKGFKPDFFVLDSLTSLASAFTGREYSYRIYIDQLFRFFEELGSTNFLITETKQIPEIFSTSGVEEFLADGVIVLYNIRRENIRENAVEVLKMRGEKHQKKIVAMQVTDKGIVVYPQQEVFGGLGNKE